MDVDLFIDGETVTVLEINPRFGGAYPVSHLAGAEFPRRIVAMLRGEPLTPQIGEHAIGVRMMKDYAILPWWEGEVVDRRVGAAADRSPGMA
jgi:carbamoyl-phosphate synthase large subunit